MSKRVEKITIRVNKEELEILKEKAKHFDGNVSKFARFCIEEAITGNSIPKSKTVWFLQEILSDPELKKNKKLQKYCEEVFECL